MALAITDIQILVDDEVVPAGYKKIPVDLNAGAGGRYLFLAYKQDETQQNPKDWVTALDVIEGKDAAQPAGWIKDSADLNAGAGGKFLYLAYKKGGSGNPIKEIQIIEAKYTPENIMLPGYKYVDRDLNQGSGGKWLYLVYSYLSQNIGLVAIQMSMLPDGRVLCYGSPLQG